MEELNVGKVIQYLAQNNKHEDTTELLWLGCPICGCDMILDFYIWKDKVSDEWSLIVVCDGCGKEYSIPLNEEDILRYIGIGIQQELNEEYE